MIAIWLLRPRRYVLDGRLHEVDADGETWIYFPKCVKCGKMFAEPASGLVCCVCLAGKKSSKIKDL